MTEVQPDSLARLPARLREARRTQSLSLEAVANLSGVSRSMVSQIERGESSPTIATLWNLTRALQVDFAGLLDDETEPEAISVLRDGEVPGIDNVGRGCRIRILSPPEDAGRHELYELLFDAAGTLASQPHARGTREQLIVLDGCMTVTSGTAQSRLSRGDTARYAADVGHSITAGDGPARALLVVRNA